MDCAQESIFQARGLVLINVGKWEYNTFLSVKYFSKADGIGCI